MANVLLSSELKIALISVFLNGIIKSISKIEATSNQKILDAKQSYRFTWYYRYPGSF